MSWKDIFVYVCIYIVRVPIVDSVLYVNCRNQFASWLEVRVIYIYIYEFILRMEC